MTNGSLQILPGDLLELSHCVVEGGFLLGEAFHFGSDAFLDGLCRCLNVELAVSSEGDPADFQFLIGLEVLIPDDVF